MRPIESTGGAPHTSTFPLSCSTHPLALTHATSLSRPGNRSHDVELEGVVRTGEGVDEEGPAAGADPSSLSRASSSIERILARSSSGGSRSATSLCKVSLVQSHDCRKPGGCHLVSHSQSHPALLPRSNMHIPQRQTRPNLPRQGGWLSETVSEPEPDPQIGPIDQSFVMRTREMTHHSVRVIAVKFGVELRRAGHVVLLVAIRHRKNREQRMERSSCHGLLRA